ncbi:MAG: hypothetical protein IPM57_11790 [Oligoflexia bacterium]|nr:hypothetical protein [Oligoflexia bacterium]
MKYLIAIILFSFSAKAAELQVTTGLTHLTSSYTYNYLSYRAALGLGIGSDAQWTIHAGLTHPFMAHGFNQTIYRAAITRDWFIKPGSNFTLFVGVGVGGYSDNVSNSTQSTGEVIPAIVFQGGFKWGGPGFGLLGVLDDYSGIYNLYHLPFVIWSLHTFSLGIYATF